MFGLQNELWGVDTFVFSTSLTRITSLIRSKAITAALEKVSQQALDWSGGTNIGRSLQIFNRDFARAWLPHTVAGGSRADVAIEIPAPNEPGRYALKFDLVSEGIDWFERCGSRTTIKALVVR